MSGATATGFEAAYLELYRSGELKRRVRLALAELEHCCVCPRRCGVNRLQDEHAVCYTGRHARVSSFFAHFGEEDPLRGTNGSGTIFFSYCNLKCVFCQNHDISQGGGGQEVGPDELAAMMLYLQETGCHNINFVTPEHVVPQMLEALLVAIENGLRLPIVYNTSAYDSMRSLELLDGVVDIYMPDFKFWDPEPAFTYVKARDYPEVARKVLCEMHRQVGVLRLDGRGIAQRGVLVRHLVMPEDVTGTAQIMRFLSKELSPDTYVNIMGQYRPEYKAERFSEINRRPRRAEMQAAYEAARQAGLHRFDGRRGLP